jgi:hypothetical protein
MSNRTLRATSEAGRNRIKELWLGIPETWRTHLKSAFDTFVAAFLTEALTILTTSSDFSFTRTAVYGLLTAAIRAGVKASSTATLVRVVPDPKKV